MSLQNTWTIPLKCFHIIISVLLANSIHSTLHKRWSFREIPIWVINHFKIEILFLFSSYFCFTVYFYFVDMAH